jgi:hypothetical protein
LHAQRIDSDGFIYIVVGVDDYPTEVDSLHAQRIDSDGFIYIVIVD